MKLPATRTADALPSVRATRAEIVAVLVDGGPVALAGFDADAARVVRDGRLIVIGTEPADDNHACPVTATALLEAGVPEPWAVRTVGVCRTLFAALGQIAMEEAEEAAYRKAGDAVGAFAAAGRRELARSAALALAEGPTARALLLAAAACPIGWRALANLGRQLGLDAAVRRGLHAAEQQALDRTRNNVS